MQPETKNYTSSLFLEGLSEIANSYNHYIIDVWGVIHNGVELYPHSRDALEHLFKNNKKVVFVTNTSQSADRISQSLQSMGIGRHLCLGNIVTAGDCAHEKIEEFKGKTCFFLGDDTHLNSSGKFDLNTVEEIEGADFILNSIGASYSSENEGITALIEHGLDADIPMICTNPDLHVDHGGQIYNCAGYYADWYETHGGTVYWYGKPHASIYQKAYELLGRPAKSGLLAIGDSLRTDITGANNFGIDSVWNLAGTTKNLTDEKALEQLEDENLSVRAILRGFCW